MNTKLDFQTYVFDEDRGAFLRGVGQELMYMYQAPDGKVILAESMEGAANQFSCQHTAARVEAADVKSVEFMVRGHAGKVFKAPAEKRVKLNDSYTVYIREDGIHVGCQVIPVSKLRELLEACNE